jgi:hypothetical protein
MITLPSAVLQHLVGRDVRVVVAEAPGRRPGSEIVRALIGEHRDQRIEQREVEVLALAGFRAMRERGADRDARIHAGDQVGNRNPRLLRPAAGAIVRARRCTLIMPPMPWIMKSIARGARATGRCLPEAGPPSSRCRPGFTFASCA